jgi:4-amino-4-deoxy-L-arabinose transferase-like glycosyltransferase
VWITAKTHDRGSAHRHDIFVALALFLLAGIGVARIVSTYHIFNQTTDEPASLAPGIEWLEQGTYHLDPVHPPLARVAIALVPYLSGLRLTGQTQDVWDTGTAILQTNHRYLHNLSMARLGVLPFFLLATVLVWYWSRVRYGDGPALLATLLFTTSPVVLGHAGVATTDLAIAATFTGALLAYINLLERPTYFRAAVVGVAAGLATLSKFSALGFLPACGLALLVWRWLLERGKKEKEKVLITDQFRWSRGLPLAAAAMCLVVWAGYRFSVGQVTDAPRPHVTVDHFVGPKGTLHDWAYSVVESHWVPAPALLQGLSSIGEHNAAGHKSFLLGQVRQRGWWYFFPVALAVKNTIPVLVLTGVGIFYLGKSTWLERNWIMAAPVVAALTILLVCLPSHINIGVRYVLPMFPLLAIIGGVGAYRLWTGAGKRYARALVVLILLAWQLTSSVRSHPDYLAYFNEFAGRHPEKILLDSDLDWGQDLLRLSAVLRQKEVDKVSIAYAGSADLSQFDLPPFRQLTPHQPTAGWVAISLLPLKIGAHYIPTDSFYWLEAYRPVCLVGRSIRLYYVPDPPSEQREPIERLPAGADDLQECAK